MNIRFENDSFTQVIGEDDSKKLYLGLLKEHSINKEILFFPADEDTIGFSEKDLLVIIDEMRKIKNEI